MRTTSIIRRGFATSSSNIPFSQMSFAELSKAVEENRPGIEAMMNASPSTDPEMQAAMARLEASVETVGLDLNEVSAELKLPTTKRGDVQVNPRFWFELFRIADEQRSATLTWRVFSAWRRYERAVLLLRREKPQLLSSEAYLRATAAMSDEALEACAKDSWRRGLLGELLATLFARDQAGAARAREFAKSLEDKIDESALLDTFLEETRRAVAEFSLLAEQQRAAIQQIERLCAEAEDESKRIGQIRIEEIAQRHPEWVAEAAWAQRQHKWFEDILPPVCLASPLPLCLSLAFPPPPPKKKNSSASHALRRKKISPRRRNTVMDITELQFEPSTALSLLY
jgi:hypothetical protein